MRPRLIASASGNEGNVGGVFAVAENDCELLDPLPTTGLAISPKATRLARLTWIQGHSDVSELVVNDDSGLLSYRRLDEVREPHSLLWLGDELHAVSTGSNTVVVLDDAGRPRRSWRPAGVPADVDRWHFNSLTAVGDRVLVSGFGRFDTPRGWGRPGALEGAGFVMDPATGATVISGLSAPHDPVWVGDGWLICNSLDGEVWRLDASGRRTAAVHLGGWTRGLLVDCDVVHVGVSAHRLAAPVERARIAVLDRSSLREIARYEMPSRDVFALVPYDEHLANGLRVGANLGVTRNLGSSAVVMDRPLDETDSIAGLTLVEATSDTATVCVSNRSSAVLSSLGRHPVRVGARWWDDSTGEWVEVSRADLPSPLYPNRDSTVRLDVPHLPPRGIPMRICVLQEMVRWFDEVSPEAALEIYPQR